MNKRQTRWILVVPGILSFIFMLLALIFKVSRASRGDSASTAMVAVVLPLIVGLGIVIVPVIFLVRRADTRYRRAMAELQSRYPHVYYTIDFRYGQRLLVADGKTVSIWRARRKKLEKEVSWQRGTVTFKQARVPVSRAVSVPGIIFTDPQGKWRRMAISDKVSARIEPIDYSAFLPFIQ